MNMKKPPMTESGKQAREKVKVLLLGLMVANLSAFGRMISAMKARCECSREESILVNSSMTRFTVKDGTSWQTESFLKGSL